MTAPPDARIHPGRGARQDRRGLLLFTRGGPARDAGHARRRRSGLRSRQQLRDAVHGSPRRSAFPWRSRAPSSTTKEGREQGSIGFAKDISQVARSRPDGHARRSRHQPRPRRSTILSKSLVNQVELLDRFLRANATPEQYEAEHERVEASSASCAAFRPSSNASARSPRSGIYGRRIHAGPFDDGPRRARQHAARAHAVGACSHEPPSRGKTILIVDDDGGVCASMADILGCEGCRIITTPSGIEALRYLAAHARGSGDQRRADARHGRLRAVPRLARLAPRAARRA